MRFTPFRSWVMPDYQPIEEDAKIATRAIFDLVTLSKWTLIQQFKAVKVIINEITQGMIRINGNL